MRRVLNSRGHASFQQLQESLATVLPSIITINFMPSGSQNHVDAVLVDIVQRLKNEEAFVRRSGRDSSTKAMQAMRYAALASKLKDMQHMRDSTARHSEPTAPGRYTESPAPAELLQAPPLPSQPPGRDARALPG